MQAMQRLNLSLIVSWQNFKDLKESLSKQFHVNVKRNSFDFPTPPNLTPD